MTKRKLGRSGIEIQPIIFGGNVFGWTIDQKKSFEILDGFVEKGFDCIDTADIYSTWVPGNKGGDSEAIIGQWMKARGNRDKMVVLTKVGKEMPEGKGLKKEYIMQAVERSLKNLQTDFIDLYQSHEDDKSTPLDETLAAYDQLIQQGKVRAIGASNYEASRFKAALEVSEKNKLARYETMQPHYNLYDRSEFESGMQQLCLKEGVGVITYFSLASGFLTGKYRSEADAGKSVRGGGMKNYLNDKGLRILKALDEVSKETQSQPTAVSLAWLLNRPGVTAPIVSATNLDQLAQVLRAAEIRLTEAQMNKLTQAGQES